MPLLFYTVSVGQQPRYILPVLPPLAVLIGTWLAERWRTGDGRGMRGAMRIFGLMASALGTGMLVAWHVREATATSAS